MRTQPLPEWFIEDIDITHEHARSRQRVGYVRRGLSSLVEVIARELTKPVCAASWLGNIEPRAKLVGIFGLIIVSTFIHSPGTLAVMMAMVLITTLSIRLPAASLGRVWAGVPLFSLALILPAVTNLVTPGNDVLILVQFKHALHIGAWVSPNPVSITDAGLIVAGRFLLRTLICVTLCYLLIATTESSVLLNGLRRLGMPKAFGMVLTMSQRYLTVIIKAAEEIHLAKLSRTISTGTMKGEQRWVAAGMGMLFRRTHKLAQEVQNSMISRGYDGDLQVRRQSDIRTRDIAWMLAILLIGIGLLFVDKIGICSIS
ncbi:MAG: cobalt ECF transporter T component CbiQ [Armatimonadota bacterium]